MPTNDRLWLDDGENSKGRWKPAVKLDQKQPIEVRQLDPAARLTPQHHYLMPQRHILRLKPAFRFERRDQDAQDEP